jgi:hypothetical protein
MAGGEEGSPDSDGLGDFDLWIRELTDSTLIEKARARASEGIKVDDSDLAIAQKAAQFQERARTPARTFLAVTIGVTLVGILGSSFTGIMLHHWPSVREWLQVVFPSETGLCGSVLGFYFGSSGKV